MSGQPYRYASDKERFRAEYMANLNLRAELDDKTLQAVKTYVSNGSLPAVSQIADTRTTAEKLMDLNSLQQNIIKDFASIMDANIAESLIQGVIQSPLNIDNRLLLFLAQRAPEIAQQLAKLYKYKIKGDSNDVFTFVEFINNMYSTKNNSTASMKSFMNRGYDKSSGMANANDLEMFVQDLRNMFALLSSKAYAGTQELSLNNPLHRYNAPYVNNNDFSNMRDARMTNNVVSYQNEEIINNIQRKIQNLIHYLPTDSQLEQTKRYIADTNNPLQAPIGEWIEFLEWMTQAMPNKEFLNSLANGIKTIIDDSRRTGKQVNNDLIRQTLERIWELIPIVPENLVEINFPDVIDYPQDPRLNRGRIPPNDAGVQTERIAGLRPSEAGDAPEEYEPPNIPYRDLTPQNHSDVQTETPNIRDSGTQTNPLLRQGRILPQVPDIPLPPEDYTANYEDDLLDYMNYRAPQPKPSDISPYRHENPDTGGSRGRDSNPKLEKLKSTIPESRSIRSKSPDTRRSQSPPFHAGSRNISRSPSPETRRPKRSAVEPKKADLGNTNSNIAVQIRNDMDDIAHRTDNIAKLQGMKDELGHLLATKDYPPTSEIKGEIQVRIRDINRKIEQQKSAIKLREKEINQKMANTNAVRTESGFGLPKRRRGRPKGSGIKIPIEDNIDRSQGIEQSLKFSPFGKYLIHNGKLRDNIISLKNIKGGNVIGLPSNKVSSHFGKVMKTIIGGGLPSFNDMNGLSDEEKKYLYLISSKANIVDKLNIPTPSKDQEEKDLHLFEVYKGEVMAGNDSKELIQKFKALLLKLSKNGSLPKQQVNEILNEILQLGY